MTLAILVHLYYHDTALLIWKRLKPLLDKYGDDIQILVNVPIEYPKLEAIKRIIARKSLKVLLFKSSNVGKDIGGKLVLLNALLGLKISPKYILFLHDKKSPQTVVGDQWMDQLASIIEPIQVDKIIALLSSDNVGMVASKEMIFNKFNKSHEEIFAGNESLINEIAQRYNLSSDNLEFVGGTMFWVKSNIFIDFFTKNNPLEIRKSLEYGNVMDNYGPTKTHSWERLFGWIISSNNNKISGV